MVGVPQTALSRGPAAFQELAARYFEEYGEKIRLATAHLDEEALWWRPGEAVNSIGNLLLHLTGNLSFWVLDGEQLEFYPRHAEE